MDLKSLPKYYDLPVIEKTGDHHAWGVFGKEDQLGCVNLLTPDRVVRAASLVRKGKVFNLDMSLGIPRPHGVRAEPFKHNMNVSRGGRMDRVDNFPLHGCGSHLDGLRHARYREFGYYQGWEDKDLDERNLLGIQNWTEHGIVGRGVLIDAPAHFERRGERLNPLKKFSITPQLIETIAKEEKVAFEGADILLLRTGLMGHYLKMTPEERLQLPSVGEEEGSFECPGLDASRDTAAWVWDNHFAGIWADNVAVEYLRVDSKVGFQHRRLIPLMGIIIGEVFNLEGIAADCAQDRVYEFMVTAKPLNVPGAAGSPANAYAIK